MNAGEVMDRLRQSLAAELDFESISPLQFRHRSTGWIIETHYVRGVTRAVVYDQRGREKLFEVVYEDGFPDTDSPIALLKKELADFATAAASG